MTQQNIILKKYNGASYDNVYPATKASDVKCTNPFTQQASNLQDTIDYMVRAQHPTFYITPFQRTSPREIYDMRIGMTWGEWVNSNFNTTQSSQIFSGKVTVLSFPVNGAIGYISSSGVEYMIRYDNDELVYDTDTIEMDKHYEMTSER